MLRHQHKRDKEFNRHAADLPDLKPSDVVHGSS